MDEIIKNYKYPKTINKENKINANNQADIKDIKINNDISDSKNTVSIAITVNDVVVDVISVHESFSETLIKDAKFIVLPKNEKTPMTGWQYFEGKFISFEEYTNLFPITLRG
jgi:hypothetical protein